MGYVDLLILSLDPSELVNNLVTPLVHAFIADVHLGVQDPKETEAFARENLNGDVHDL